MSTPVGLGEPRGPHFVSDSLRRRPVPPQQAPQQPPQQPAGQRPGAEPPAAPGPTRRALLGTALMAVVAGSVGGGIAGLITGRQSEPSATDTGLPRSSGGPVTGDLSDVAERVLPSVVSVQVRRGTRTATGSGFVVDRRGHVVTNAHVVGTADEAELVLDNGRRVPAEVVGRDVSTDIAVLRAASVSGLTPLRLGRSADVEVGDQVLAIGSPLGLSGTVTAGIVSAVDRQVTLGSGRQSVVQTDTSINPGNSGGPLVNARGEVIGVNTAIASLGENSGNIGIGFAIPVDRASAVADRIIRS
ncbi:MAG: S1C family serine protease [Micromonosporaceae bacterium]